MVKSPSTASVAVAPESLNVSPFSVSIVLLPVNIITGASLSSLFTTTVIVAVLVVLPATSVAVMAKEWDVAASKSAGNERVTPPPASIATVLELVDHITDSSAVTIPTTELPSSIDVGSPVISITGKITALTIACKPEILLGSGVVEVTAAAIATSSVLVNGVMPSLFLFTPAFCNKAFVSILGSVARFENSTTLTT